MPPPLARRGLGGFTRIKPYRLRPTRRPLAQQKTTPLRVPTPVQNAVNHDGVGGGDCCPIWFRQRHEWRQCNGDLFETWRGLTAAAINVTVTAKQPRLFSSYWLSTCGNILASSIAIIPITGGDCMLALGSANLMEPSQPMEGPLLTLSGCGLFSDSTNTSSISLSGGGKGQLRLQRLRSGTAGGITLLTAIR